MFKQVTFFKEFPSYVVVFSVLNLASITFLVIDAGRVNVQYILGFYLAICCPY